MKFLLLPLLKSLDGLTIRDLWYATLLSEIVYGAELSLVDNVVDSLYLFNIEYNNVQHTLSLQEFCPIG